MTAAFLVALFGAASGLAASGIFFAAFFAAAFLGSDDAKTFPASARKSKSLSQGMSVCPVKARRMAKPVSFSSATLVRVDARTSSGVWWLLSSSQRMESDQNISTS